MQSNQEIIVTLIGGTFFLLFLVGVVIVAAMRYQNRKRIHLMDVQRLKFENEQQLLKSKVEVQEKTLKEVSQEIHDNIGQILSVVKLNLHTLPVVEEKAKNQVNGTIDLVTRAIGDLRNLSKVLNSDFIAQQPISFLLQREVDVINKANKFILNFDLDGEEIDLVPDKKLVLFRIMQECLQNAIKHSNAKRIHIKLKFTEELCLASLIDDGIGFDYERLKSGNGLTNLRSRAKAIQGELDITSAPGNGTSVMIKVPFS